MRAPVARGISFDGSSATIPATGKPSVVVFIAHWCAHCQRDVAAIAPVLARSMPSDIAIMSVVTLTDPSLPNYPPSTWLKDKDWKPAVLLDDKNASVANAYGLQGTPLWVFIGKDGLVRFRVEGELGVSAFQQALARLRAGP
jgi:thiol-disulfide isomerase/thioredoxin